MFKKKTSKIHFMGFGNKETYCIFKTCYLPFFLQNAIYFIILFFLYSTNALFLQNIY
jgi:hypothetical protein